MSTTQDWIDVLAKECDRTNQAATAELIGYSPGVVSAVLKGKYKGDLQAVENAVKGALMQAQVSCPVLGALPTHQCLMYQRRGFANTNPIRVQLYRACRNGCEHSRYAKESTHEH